MLIKITQLALLAIVNVNGPAPRRRLVMKKQLKPFATQGQNVIPVVIVKSLGVPLAELITMTVNVTQPINVNIVIRELLVPGQAFLRDRFVTVVV